MKNTIRIIALLFLCCHSSVYGQKKNICPPTASKKAEKYLEQAREARNDKKPFPAIKALCEKSLSEDSLYADAWKLWGDAAWQARKDEEMVKAYIKLIELCPDINPDIYYRVADQLFQTKSFEAAIRYYRSFLDFPKVKEENARDAEQKITKAGFMMKPVPFDPKPLSGVCGPDPEYLAIISPDQDLCFFTRRFEEQKKGALTPVSVEKFMISKKSDGGFERGEPMPWPFNKAGSNNEGGATITIDNRHLFFTVNKNGNFDIYTSDESNGSWSEPSSVGVGVNHPERWESQPCITPDGKKLFFVTIRDSVNQTSDIYVSTKAADGTWGKAVPMEGNINTEGNEKTPFIHPDNRTFYFSSDRHPGMGGYDIFMSKIQANGSFSSPVNIGYPINTEADELGFFVSTDGRNGYFASNQIKGAGGYDIYSFELPDHARPDKVLFIKGELKGEDDAPPGAASLQLKNANTQEVTEVVYDSVSGRFASVVLFDDDYILTVKKKGFAYTSSYFSSADSAGPEPKKVDFRIRRNEKGSTHRLNDILFQTGSAELTRQDQTVLRDFVDYLKENATMKLEVHGHTDNIGNAEQNLMLSEARAKRVYQFLIENGIQSARLSYKGFGMSRPVADNSGEQGRSLNRRTEFVILNP